MFFESGGGDEDVVHVNENLPSGDEVFEGIIHHGLKGSRGVAKAEKHNKGFEHPAISFEGCFPLVAVLDPDVIIPPANVEFAKDFRVFEFVRNVRNKRKGVLIFYREVIELTVMCLAAGYKCK